MPVNTCNLLSDDIILALSKLKALTDDDLIMAQMAQFFFDMVENIMGKGENTDNQHFLLFPQCFQNTSFLRALNGGIVRIKVNVTEIHHLNTTYSAQGNPSFTKSWSQSFRRSLKFHSEYKRLMTWSIHPGH